MFAVMPYEAVIRNPRAGITQGWEDIAPAGADTRVFPLKITHTTSDAHAGTNTACSGLGVYRGDLMPELKGNIFVPDPTGQLVTHYKVEANGASLKATRVGDRTEFFRSSDEWCRPVNITTGPDGALYVSDMYRRYIDHARFFPEEFVKTHDIRQGENEGRIWRIVPKGKKARKIEPAPAKDDELVAWLAHENAWQRETAQRLLFEMKSPKAPAADHAELADQARGEFLNTIEIGGNTDETVKDAPEGVTTTSILASRIALHPADIWFTNAVLSGASQRSGRILAALADDELMIRSAGIGPRLPKRKPEPYFTTASQVKTDTIRRLTVAALEDAVEADVAALVKLFSQNPGQMTWWKPALLQGLAEGLPRSGGKLGVKSLSEFLAKTPDLFREAAIEITSLLKSVDETMMDKKASLENRLAVIPLLSQRPWDKAEPVMRDLLAEGQAPEITQASLLVLKKYPADKTAPLLYDLLPTAGPLVRREIVSILSTNPKTVLDLFKRMDKSEISSSLVDVETRWRWQRGKGEIRDLAVKLFGQASQDRAAVIADYMAVTKMNGDAARGKQVFATVCISCHKIGDLGFEVGPPLSDVKAKPPEALLSDILDPNRMVEARWSAYQIETKDGRTLLGLITNETSENVTIKMMGGITEAVQRSNINKMVSTDRSLMPPGLEAAITKEQMADLLAFLRGGN